MDDLQYACFWFLVFATVDAVSLRKGLTFANGEQPPSAGALQYTPAEQTDGETRELVSLHVHDEEDVDTSIGMPHTNGVSQHVAAH